MDSFGTLAFAASVLAMTTLTANMAHAAEEGDLGSDTWVATDALGRKLPLGGEVRAPRKDRFVGVFYFVWQGFHGTGGPHDLSKILAADPRNPQFGGLSAFHWWGEPEVGYYRATDPWVARRNLSMLGVAGVDVLFVDVTNAFTYPAELKVLFETARQMRAQGNPTPQIAFIMNANTVPTMQRLWDEWYSQNSHPELWFRWQGKPLILGDKDDKTKDGKTIPAAQQEFFTWRRSWFESDPKGWFGDGRDKWPWRDKTPQNYGWHDDPKVPEQVAVGVASHPVGENIGRSYANKTRVKVDQFDSTTTFEQGIQFEEQWKRALEVDPQMIFVTGWNEWVAQRFVVAKNQKINLVGRELQEGETFFVDLYNAEFSRDADPMKGGYTDNYYYQLVANIRRFKGARPLPRPGKPQTIALRKSFAQWQNIAPEFRDSIGDTLHRDHAGWGDLHYTNTTGRNDIMLAKAARDARHLYFYARTAGPLSPRDGRAWMLLLLDTDQNSSTGWHGYDFRVNGQVGAKSSSLERWAGGRWQKVAEVPYRSAGNELHLSIPRRLLNQQDRVALDFKWADNINPDGGIETFFLDGDVAPPRRFNYRFEEAARS